MLRQRFCGKKERLKCDKLRFRGVFLFDISEKNNEKSYKILVLNSGSSSLKFKLFQMPIQRVLAYGVCERIATDSSRLNYFRRTDVSGNENFEEINVDERFESHGVAFDRIMSLLFDEKAGILHEKSEISLIGHRVVHGGTYFKNPVKIDSDVIEKIEKLSSLAPIHNPANLNGIRACYKFFGDKTKQVAVFDTAFYADLPPEAYTYAIPKELAVKHSIRKYGFHGTSHRFVTEKCAHFLNKILGKSNKNHKIVSCHLGSGSSITAVKNGIAVDTTMGFTPLDGLIMATRCGQIDPSIITFLLQNEDFSAAELEKILNEKSGFLGITGNVHDMRDLDSACQNGDKDAILARKIMIYQIVKIIGGYIGILGGCDAICFTGGIAVNHAKLRREICEKLDFFGVKINNINERTNERTFNLYEKGKGHVGACAVISSTRSRIPIFVVPCDEELAIARECMCFLS